MTKLQENKIECVQLALKKSIADVDFSVGNYSGGLAHFVDKKLKDAGVHVSVLGCYINPTNPNEEKRQAEMTRFIEHLRYAKSIGADMVGTETGRLDEDFNIVPGTYTETCYQRLLKTMRPLVAAAEKLGVIIGVEGVATHTLYSPEMMQRFLDDIDSPNVEVILDAVNLLDRITTRNRKQFLIRHLSFMEIELLLHILRISKLMKMVDVSILNRLGKVY